MLSKIKIKILLTLAIPGLSERFCCNNSLTIEGIEIRFWLIFNGSRTDGIIKSDLRINPK